MVALPQLEHFAVQNAPINILRNKMKDVLPLKKVNFFKAIAVLFF